MGAGGFGGPRPLSLSSLAPLMPRSLAALASLTLGGLALAACQPGGDAPAADSAATAPAAADTSLRIVALGGAVTETLYDLGLGDRVVAVDQSSVYPADVRTKPVVGYFRTLGAEAVLSARPTLVLADHAAGPPEALAGMRAAGVRVETLPGGPSADSVAALVTAIGAATGRTAEAAVLVDSLRARLARAEARLAGVPTRPRVLFVQGQGPGMIGLAGSNTNADAFIRLAGGTNALAAADGYKPMTPEAVAEAAPEVIVMTGRTAGVAGGPEAFLQRPGVALTPAARSGRVIVVPDEAMSFGPALGQAVLDLQARLHGGAR